MHAESRRGRDGEPSRDGRWPTETPRASREISHQKDDNDGIIRIGTALAITMATAWLALLCALAIARPDGATLKDALKVLPDTIRLVRRLAGDPQLPRSVRRTLWLLGGYLAMPFDLVPDFIPVIGYADDDIVAAIVLRRVVRAAGGEALERHWTGTPSGLAVVLRLAGLRKKSEPRIAGVDAPVRVPPYASSSPADYRSFVMVTDNLSKAYASTRGVLSNVKADQLNDPTPCKSWTVRDLINHIVGGAHWVGATTEAGESAPQSETDWTEGDMVASFDEGVASGIAAFGMPGAQDKIVRLPFGEFPGSVYMALATTDTFTHGWDLAKATGQSTDLDPELAEQLLQAAGRLVPDQFRGEEPMPFGPRVEAPAGATAADRLAAFMGRQP